MNTASRMESTGKAGRVQISGETARLLEEAGKSEWFQPRATKVFVKGKGELQTYWLINATSSSGNKSVEFSVAGDNAAVLKEEHNDLVQSNDSSRKYERLVEWNSEILCKYLKPVVARRLACEEETSPSTDLCLPQSTVGDTVRDHVSDVIPFPEYRPIKSKSHPDMSDFDSKVPEQVRFFVQQIAAMYRDNPFHNFEHASHVTMSVSKLLSRIVGPDSGSSAVQQKLNDMELHDNTLGISSDPMMQFAMIFAALVHDVDHVGVVCQ